MGIQTTTRKHENIAGLLCDGGGSSASNRHVFKQALQRLADRLGLEIGIVFDAHLPRWNYRTVPANGRAWEVVTGHILVAFW